MPRGMFCQAKKIERKEIIKALMWEKRSILLDAFETELPTFLSQTALGIMKAQRDKRLRLKGI